MSEWKECKIKEIGQVITGKTPSVHNPEDWGNEILFITPSDYKNYRKQAYSSIRKLSGIGTQRQKNRILPPKSVLVTCIGSDMGKTVINSLPCITNQQINAIIPNQSIVDSDYIYYSTVHLYKKLRIAGSDGTAVPILNKTDFENIEISLPPLEEQKAIAEVLSSLDDKIDLLHLQNQTLENLAQTHFRHLFIDNAKDDWEERKLGDVIEIFNNKRIPLSQVQRDKMKDGNLYPYYGAASIMDDINQYIFDGKYILMGEDGTVRTKDGCPILQYATGKFWVNNHTHVIRAKLPYDNFFIWLYLSKKNIDEIVTGAVQPKISLTNLKNLDFPKFPVKLVDKFISLMSGFFDKIDCNKEQIKNLEKLRDQLLPKLMSGEIRINWS